MRYGLRTLLIIVAAASLWCAFAHYAGVSLALILGAPPAAVLWDLLLERLEDAERIH